MKECTGQHISEKLAMALSPEEFRQEVDEINDHVRDCNACQGELEALRQVHRYLRTYAAQLEPSLSECPASDAIVAFAEQELPDPAIQAHVRACNRCAQEVALIAELCQETSEGGEPEPSFPEKQFIETKIAEVYGASEQGWGPRIKEAIRTLIAGLNIPSLALGAAAAALLMTVILPRGAQKDTLFPAFSNVVWQNGASQLMAKEPRASEHSVAPKRVALLIVVPEESALSRLQVDETYEKLDLAKRLRGSYEVVSPREVRTALEDKVRPGEGIEKLADQVFSTLGVDYLLCFELRPSAQGLSLSGMLFPKGVEGAPPTITQTGLALSRIPSKITAMAAQLLLDAEHS